MTDGTISITDQKSTAIAFLESFWSADLDKAYSYLSSEARFLMMPSVGEHRELDARSALNQIVALYDRFHAEHPLQCEVTSIISEGQEVAVEYIARAKTFRLEPYENYYSAHLTFKGSLIEVFRTYADTVYLNTKLSRRNHS